MKINRILILGALMALFTTCGDNTEYIKVKIGDVVKVTSEYSAYGGADIMLAWGPPTTRSGSVPRFEIDNNSLYFSPDFEEKYSIKLSVETMGGDVIVEEQYFYEGIETLSDADKFYRPTEFPSKKETAQMNRESEKEEISLKPEKENISDKPRKQEQTIEEAIEEPTPETYFTVQIYARSDKKDAYNDLAGLNALGFEDVFMEEFLLNGAKYWRVRSGKHNSRIKAENIKSELAGVLKKNESELWLLEVK